MPNASQSVQDKQQKFSEGCQEILSDDSEEDDSISVEYVDADIVPKQNAWKPEPP